MISYMSACDIIIIHLSLNETIRQRNDVYCIAISYSCVILPKICNNYNIKQQILSFTCYSKDMNYVC